MNKHKGNKHKDLKICVQLHSYDLVGITETQWDGLHDCIAVTE